MKEREFSPAARAPLNSNHIINIKRKKGEEG